MTPAPIWAAPPPHLRRSTSVSAQVLFVDVDSGKLTGDQEALDAAAFPSPFREYAHAALTRLVRQAKAGRMDNGAVAETVLQTMVRLLGSYRRYLRPGGGGASGAHPDFDEDAFIGDAPAASQPFLRAMRTAQLFEVWIGRHAAMSESERGLSAFERTIAATPPEELGGRLLESEAESAAREAHKPFDKLRMGVSSGVSALRSAEERAAAADKLRHGMAAGGTKVACAGVAALAGLRMGARKVKEQVKERSSSFGVGGASGGGASGHGGGGGAFSTSSSRYSFSRSGVAIDPCSPSGFGSPSGAGSPSGFPCSTAAATSAVGTPGGASSPGVCASPLRPSSARAAAGAAAGGRTAGCVCGGLSTPSSASRGVVAASGMEGGVEGGLGAAAAAAAEEEARMTAEAMRLSAVEAQASEAQRRPSEQERLRMQEEEELQLALALSQSLADLPTPPQPTMPSGTPNATDGDLLGDLSGGGGGDALADDLAMLLSPVPVSNGASPPHTPSSAGASSVGASSVGGSSAPTQAAYASTPASMPASMPTSMPTSPPEKGAGRADPVANAFESLLQFDAPAQWPAVAAPSPEPSPAATSTATPTHGRADIGGDLLDLM